MELFLLMGLGGERQQTFFSLEKNNLFGNTITIFAHRSHTPLVLFTKNIQCSVSDYIMLCVNVSLHLGVTSLNHVQHKLSCI